MDTKTKERRVTLLPDYSYAACSYEKCESKVINQLISQKKNDFIRTPKLIEYHFGQRILKVDTLEIHFQEIDSKNPKNIFVYSASTGSNQVS